MKCVMCKEEDGPNLIRALEVAAFKGRPYGSNTNHIIERYKLTDADLQMLMKDMHGIFVYQVVQWLTEHGFKVTCNY